MSIPSNVRTKFVPHKELQEGWTYISIPEDNIIIGVKLAVTKVVKLFNADGSPMKDQTGNPVYSFQSSNVVKLLSNDEYSIIKNVGGE